MNELEMLGLKEKIKEVIEEETDIKTRLDDLEEDIKEIRGEKTSEYDDPDSDLPEEEELEDNPAREQYEEDVEKIKDQVTDGGRVTKDTMNKIQNPPTKKLHTQANKEVDEFENDFNDAEETEKEL